MLTNDVISFEQPGLDLSIAVLDIGAHSLRGAIHIADMNGICICRNAYANCCNSDTVELQWLEQ